jgi:two-component system, NtrC family, response regulator AtoC
MTQLRTDRFDHTATLNGEDTPFVAEKHPAVPETPRFLLVIRARSGVLVSELSTGASLCLGRVAPADVIVEDSSVSRSHARLDWHRDGVLVTDLGSKNGTFLAGDQIEHGLVRPGMEVVFGSVVLEVRRPSDGARRGFEAFERFLSRSDEELVRARLLNRPLSLLMLRALSGADGWWLNVRAALRPIDTVAVYAPDVLLILLPELSPAETLLVAQTLVKPVPRQPELVCGVATLQQGARTAQALIGAASSACWKARSEQRVVHSPVGEAGDSAGPLVVSEPMQEVYRLAKRVASHGAPLLILGETGVGKELVARCSHAAGARRDGPFRAINCGAIAATLLESVLFGHERGAFTGATETRKGVFEEAHGGTLFLDEVGELPLPAQAALLRVLETKQVVRVGGTRQYEVDVRVVSATHCDLEAMVAAKTFRADLYHRLNLLTVHVPPLRERADEIEPLALHFLRAPEVRKHTGADTISAPALARLRAYGWPGNVRELRNVIERAALLCDGAVIEADDLPQRMTAAQRSEPASEPRTGGFASLVRSYEIQLIRAALQSAGGNQTKAAEQLGMPLRTLVYKLRSYGLRQPVTDTEAEAN